ncbi:MAG: ATP-binding protein [Candidatus Aphodosoma sp.]
MNINRDIYLQRLIDSRHNHMIKVITGMRRCGKSYLLFHLFAEWLLSEGILEDHIISVNLEDRRNKTLRDPDNLLAYIDGKMVDKEMYYILLDEIQMVAEFEDVLNSYLNVSNADVYVTGSNARFLSKDVITEFRGRGDEIHMLPLSFSEFFSAYEGDYKLALDEYLTYGGLPQILTYKTEKQKADYLKGLFTKTYISDIVGRYNLKHEEELGELVNIVASAVGSLTNPTKIVNTFSTVKNLKISNDTVKNWLDYLCDSFLVSRSMRYDVKDRRYIDTPSKYYFSDLGLRNARLNFRQNEKTHLMENLIYNELLYRGFNVDVGVVTTETITAEGKRHKVQLEIDFVCNMGSKRYYIQSAYKMDTDEKRRQECLSLSNVDDSFKKIVIVADDQLVHHDEHGITTICLKDFLTNPLALEL